MDRPCFNLSGKAKQTHFCRQCKHLWRLYLLSHLNSPYVYILFVLFFIINPQNNNNKNPRKKAPASKVSGCTFKFFVTVFIVFMFMLKGTPHPFLNTLHITSSEITVVFRLGQHLSTGKKFNGTTLLGMTNEQKWWNKSSNIHYFKHP